MQPMSNSKALQVISPNDLEALRSAARVWVRWELFLGLSFKNDAGRRNRAF